MDPKIRKGTISDINKIGVLWEELMVYHANLDPYFKMKEGGKKIYKEFLLHLLKEPEKNRIYIAENGSIIIGYVLGIIQEAPPVFETKYYGDIMDIYVAEGFRRQSFGGKLVDELKNWFQTRGITRIELNAAAKNPISNIFWEKQGFHPHLNRKAFSF